MKTAAFHYTEFISISVGSLHVIQLIKNILLSHAKATIRPNTKCMYQLRKSFINKINIESFDLRQARRIAIYEYENNHLRNGYSAYLFIDEKTNSERNH